MNFSLTKSNISAGLQCHKSLWLRHYKPQLKKKIKSRAKQYSLEAGQEVASLAKQLFCDDSDGAFLFDSTFQENGIKIQVDILHKKKKGWELYKVRKTSRIRNSYILDLAIQYYALKKIDRPLVKASLVYINNEYCCTTDKVAPDHLFLIKDLTIECEKREKSIADSVDSMFSIDSRSCPPIDIGKHCFSPYPCDFIDSCRTHLPNQSVFDLKGKGVDKFNYYKKGIISFSDLREKKINFKQRQQVEAELTGKITLHTQEIQRFLHSLTYPLFFLDFEAFQMPIPPFIGTKPYEQIVFQYSLHHIEKKGSSSQHYEFLMEPGKDDRKKLTKSLISHIPSNACVVTYNMLFEKLILRNLARLYPSCRDELLSIHDAIIDLMIPFQKRHYYTKEMNGSYSLKNVLPALVPDLTYDTLTITNGEEAMSAYLLLLTEKDPEEKNTIRNDLLKYCHLDTYALVKLVLQLEKVIKK